MFHLLTLKFFENIEDKWNYFVSVWRVRLEERAERKDSI